MIQYISSASAFGINMTLPEHQAGDLIVIYASRTGSNTPPSTPGAPWVDIDASLGGSGSASGAAAYLIASSSSEVSGDWLAANALTAVVYRGVDTTSPIPTYQKSAGWGSSVSYPALTMAVTDGTSWAALFGFTRHSSGDFSGAVAGTTGRSGIDDDSTTAQRAYDTDGGVSSWTSKSQAVASGSNAVFGIVMELRAAVAPSYNVNSQRSATITGVAPASVSSYRKLFHVAATADGTLTNYQKRVVVHKGSGTDSGDHVYSTRFRDDFADVRFYAADGTTELPYYLEQYTSGTAAVFWVKLNTVAASTGTDFYIDYGNAMNTTTTSSGSGTFEMFDAMDNSTLLTTAGGAGGVSIAYDAATKKQGSHAAKNDGAAQGYKTQLYGGQSFSRTGYIVEAWVRIISGGGTNENFGVAIMMNGAATTSNGYMAILDGRSSSSPQIRRDFNNSLRTDGTVQVYSDNWYFMSLSATSAAISTQLWRESDLYTDTPWATNGRADTGYTGSGLVGIGSYSQNHSMWDAFRVRKNTANPPSISSWGSEAVVSGEVDTGDERSARITGSDTASNTRSATITGAVVANDSRSATIHGIDTISSERAAFIRGADQASNERAAMILGALGSNDTRSATIRGLEGTSSERSATIFGGVVSPQYAISNILSNQSRQLYEVVIYPLEVETPGDSYVQYHVTSNNGSTWEAITPGEVHTFAAAGTRLRWRITLYASSDGKQTPTVGGIDAVWTYTPSVIGDATIAGESTATMAAAIIVLAAGATAGTSSATMLGSIAIQASAAAAGDSSANMDAVATTYAAGALAGGSTATMDAINKAKALAAAGGSSTATMDAYKIIYQMLLAAGDSTAILHAILMIENSGDTAGDSTASLDPHNIVIASMAAAGGSSVFMKLAEQGEGTLAGDSTATISPQITAYGAATMAGDSTADLQPQVATSGAAAMAGDSDATLQPSITVLVAIAVAGTSSASLAVAVTVLAAMAASGSASSSLQPLIRVLAAMLAAGNSTGEMQGRATAYGAGSTNGQADATMDGRARSAAASTLGGNSQATIRTLIRTTGQSNIYAFATAYLWPHIRVLGATAIAGTSAAAITDTLNTVLADGYTSGEATAMLAPHVTTRGRAVLPGTSTAIILPVVVTDGIGQAHGQSTAILIPLIHVVVSGAANGSSTATLRPYVIRNRGVPFESTGKRQNYVSDGSIEIATERRAPARDDGKRARPKR